MRRSEFEVNDPAEIAQTLEACEYGVLSIISQGEPYGSAVNFVYLDGCIYFHGSREGRSVDRRWCWRVVSRGQAAGVHPVIFQRHPFCLPCDTVFCFGPCRRNGCAAAGRRSEIGGAKRLDGENAAEGGYEAITPHNPIYAAMLEKTGVYCLRPDTVSFKIKAGQNLSSSRFAALSQRLVQRGGVADGVTLEMMGKVHDHEH